MINESPKRQMESTPPLPDTRVLPEGPLTFSEARELVELFVNMAPRLIWISDQRGNYRYETKAWCDVIGQERLEDRIHPDDRARRVEVRNNALRFHRAYQIQYRIQTSDGRFLWLLERAQPLYTDRIFVGLIATCMDVSKDRDEESRANQRQRLETLGRLAGGVAHDFNNLLAVIVGYAQTLREDLSPEQVAQRDDLTEILNAAELGRSITQQLLAFSCRQVLKTVSADLNEVVGEFSPFLQQACGEKISLVVKPNPQAAIVSVDSGQLGQVLLNLVLNSKDAMPDGGIITISVGIDAGGVALRVTDTGMGIDAGAAQHIFEPFFSTKSPDKGTGLGLATVYGIVTQHNGTVQVDSVVGMGTTITIVLPQLERASEPNREIKHCGGTALDTRVLLIEDNTSVRAAVRRMLTSCGCTVYEARDYKSAVEVFALRSDQIDLILADVVMPEVTGPEIATCLQALRPTLPVIFMSGCADQTNSIPVDAMLLTKPFGVDDLRSAIRRTIQPCNEPMAANRRFQLSADHPKREADITRPTAKARCSVHIPALGARLRIPGEGEKDSGVNVKTIPG